MVAERNSFGRSVADRVGDPVRVFLIDDHDLFCAGLRALLSAYSGVVVVGEAQNQRAALATLPPDVDALLIDVRLPGPNGIALLREIRRRGIDTPTLMLTMCDDREFVFDAFAAGANGYALKTSTADEFVEAIKTVIAGQRYLSPALRSLTVELQQGGAPTGVLASLSSREREVFDLLANGSNNKEVASQLFIAVKTVETHRTRIFKKLRVNSLPELIRLAARHHLLEGV